MLDLNDAIVLAQRAKNFLLPYCARIEIAGSVRRDRPKVKDLEIVVIPKMIQSADLFDAGKEYSALENAPFTNIGKAIKNGSRYKQIDLGGFMLDLFIVMPPAQWGVIFAIRTGPADFSHWLVTSERRGGAMPYFAKCENGGVYSSGSLIEMPEEKDLFDFLKIDSLPPSQRKAPDGFKVNTEPL